MTKDVKTESKVKSDLSDDGVTLKAQELHIHLPDGKFDLKKIGSIVHIKSLEG